MTMDVLWFEDRFGIKGHYRTLWLQAVAKAGLHPIKIHCTCLHAHVKGQLLQRYKNRIAPTWVEEKKHEIRAAAKALFDKYQPKVIVLSSPESLALLDVDQEFATLGTLRGSAYTVFGVPAIVILPMSAWTMKISQKDIQVANYGMNSEEEMNRFAEATDVASAVESGAADADDIDSSSDDEDDDDNFFYVPVMTPVGRVMIEFDLGKLYRFVNDKAGHYWNPRGWQGNGVTLPTAYRTVVRKICYTEADCQELIQFASDCMLLAVDIETIPNMPKAKKKQPYVITVVSYSGLHKSGEVRSYALQLTRTKSAILPEPDNFDLVMRTITQVNDLPVAKTLHNGVYDCAWLIRYLAPIRNYAYDSMTLFWSLFPDLPKTLDVVSSIVTDSHRYWKMGRKDTDFLAHTLYAMHDTETTLYATMRLIEWAIQYPAMAANFNDAHRRCLIGLSMSMSGMAVDYGKRQQLFDDLVVERDSKLGYLRWLVAKDDFNPASPTQMKELLYGLLGAKPRSSKGREYKRVTSATKVSTGALAMKAMKADHPILEEVIRHIDAAKRPAKQISNVMSIPFNNDRFYTSYDGVGTTTTRFSSRRDSFGFGGNAQNIRKEYRSMLRADPNCFIFEIDLSAADDVFVSYESEDPRKIELVESGKDTHSFNAAEVFFTNWTYEQVVAGKKAKDPAVVDPITGIRQITKKTTHGANYLMAGMTLLMSAGREAIVSAAKHVGYHNAGTWSTEQLAEFCVALDEKYRRYYVRFARTGSNSFYTDLQMGLNKTGAYETIFGYTQHFSGDRNDQGTLRALAASVGQANTAGRINMALDELTFGIRYKKFRDGDAPDFDEPAMPVSVEEHGASLRFQTHDSISYNIDYTHPNWLEGVQRIMHVMQRPVISKGRIVRVGIEADVAIRWAKDVVEVKTSDHIEKAVASLFESKQD